MLWSEIGPDGDLKVCASQSVLGKGLTAGLDDGVGAASIHHLRQCGLNLRCLGCGEVGRKLVEVVIVKLVAQCGEEPRLVSGCTDQVPDQP